MQGEYKRLGAALLAAVCLTGMGAGTALAEEDLERITAIHLNIESEITAGSYDNDVDVDTDDDTYTMGGADFTNGEGEWYGGATPRLEIILYAEDGYYFGGSGRSMFSFSGTDVDYVSSRREDDNTTLIVVVDLEELEQENLQVEDAWWEGAYGVAAWEDVPAAKYYQVRLYRNGSSAGSAENVYNNNAYDFGSKITRSGEYYFEVRAVGSGSAKGEWERSNTWEVDDEDAEGLNDRNYYSPGSKYDKDYDYDDDDYDDEDDYEEEDDRDYDKWNSSSDDSDSRSDVYASDHSHITGPGVDASDRTSSADSSDSWEGSPGGTSSGRRVTSASSEAKSGSAGSGSNASGSNSKNTIGGVKTGSGNGWKQDETGWWFRFSDDSYAYNCWQMIDGKWYCFDGNGYLRYGWIASGGKWYYCGEDGAMVINAQTPDGYYVGGDGAWIQ